MNNRIFIAMYVGERQRDALRLWLESEGVFDRYGDGRLARKFSHFGFASVVPECRNGHIRWFRRMVRCSYVFFPRGWHNSPLSRKMFTWAELLGKRLVFEEDWR